MSKKNKFEVGKQLKSDNALEEVTNNDNLYSIAKYIVHKSLIFNKPKLREWTKLEKPCKSYEVNHNKSMYNYICKVYIHQNQDQYKRL